MRIQRLTCKKAHMRAPFSKITCTYFERERRHKQIYTCACRQTAVYLYTYVRSYTCAYTCVCIHTYIHTMHTCAQIGSVADRHEELLAGGMKGSARDGNGREGNGEGRGRERGREQDRPPAKRTSGGSKKDLKVRPRRVMACMWLDLSVSWPVYDLMDCMNVRMDQDLIVRIQQDLITPRHSYFAQLPDLWDSHCNILCLSAMAV
jgi:hypothetical protein